MPDHRCGTCRHFEGAPMWKKGWCRNPLLYSREQSHLVGEDDLDCNRGMGSYWAALDADLPESDPGTRFPTPQPRGIAPAQTVPGAPPARRTPPEAITVRRAGEAPIARPRARGGIAPAAHPERQVGYEVPQEPYSWGEYLRRSYPVIGVILLLGAFWVWSARQLSGGATATPTAPIVAPTTVAAPGPISVITPTAPAAAPAAPAASTLPVPPPGQIAPGARIVVQTPGGAGANIRAQPTTAGAVVTAQDDGTPLTITGASQDADGYTWWPVRGDGFAGWIAGSLIAPAP